jgi:VIT1/CCC1 family predicted Fe2+/Mn2+ transporter
MTQQSNDLRERLLAALPQPEKLAAYREETATLLARHATALRWDYFTAYAFVFLAALLFLWSFYPGPLGGAAVYSFRFVSAVLYFVGAIFVVRYHIYDSQVATLKEIKQVQLQILELQASLRKDQ